MKKLIPCVVGLALVTFALTSCGPAKSTSALWKAHQAIKRAEDAKADETAPYELTLAREYYYKAREEAGYSKYEVCEKLAEKAEEYAKRAAGEPVDTPDPTEIDPDEEVP